MDSENFDNPADLFKELDVKEHSFLAQPLAGYLKALMNEGFTRREAMRLVEAYQKFMHDLSLEEFIYEKNQEENESDVDSEDE